MTDSEPKLRITGEVFNPATLSQADLAALPAAHQVLDVTKLVANRPGTAIRLAGLLEFVQPAGDVKWLTLHAAKDDFHASIPLEQVREKGLLIYALDGQPLSPAKGGPFRFFIPDYLACHSAEIDECANVKFVDHIELTVARGLDNRPHDDAAHAALHQKP